MDKQNIEKFITNIHTSVVEAMKKIDKNSNGVIYIVDEKNSLCGCLTDGDIRRWIIKTGNLKGTALEMMNKNPKYLCETDSKDILEFMREKRISSLPIVDKDKKIKNIILIGDFNYEIPNPNKSKLKNTPVVIMAGGQGTRLYPYTKILPKPLIPICDVPILERILNRFFEYGIDEFYITVNYKKEMIKSYFNELKTPYEIHFIEETVPLGTAGSISLIEECFDSPVIITNCDILIETDYVKVIKHHLDSGNDMTVVSSLKNSIIPYGVLHFSEHGVISSIEEKPQLSYFINTGMYIINPQQLESIPKNTVFHMTDLAENLILDGFKVGMYPISEDSFLDMGQFEEMKRMEERINRRLK